MSRRCSDRLGPARCALEAGHEGHHQLERSEVQHVFDWAGREMPTRDFVRTAARKYLAIDPSDEWVDEVLRSWPR